MAVYYFLLNLLLWCFAFFAGFYLGKRERRVWIPAAVLATVVVAALGAISARADWEVHLMLWPDYVFLRESKCIIFGLFIFAIGIRQLQVRANKEEDPAKRRILHTRARLLIVLVAALGFYLGYSFKWMIFETDYTATDLPDVWDKNRICRQTTGYTCVAASLTTLCDRLGVETSQSEMARLALVRPGGGAADLNVVRALRIKLGATHTIHLGRFTYEELARAPMPALSSTLLFFPVYHCIAVLAVSPTSVVVGDPLNGKQTLSRAEFEKCWTGLVITVVPHEPSDPG